uniref:Uncharacterized protein n=1 Tax=Trichuris muris TaxID=70415 RepID=A0A5S6R4T2_TRIMR
MDSAFMSNAASFGGASSAVVHLSIPLERQFYLGWGSRAPKSAKLACSLSAFVMSSDSASRRKSSSMRNFIGGFSLPLLFCPILDLRTMDRNR